MKDILNVGIIGAGRIGKVHAATLAYRIPAARVLAVADVDLAAAQALAAKHQIPCASADHRDVLNNPDIEAVLICSATDTHARFTEEAALAGKHIFCEKPIALDLAEIDRTLATVAQAGVKLQVGFNRRFDANFRRVRRAVESGEIGQPALLHIISRDPAPPPIAYVKVSGGMFLDMTIHDFDMARYLVGAEVDEVYTQAAVTVDPAIGEAGDVDTALIVLRFADGVIGTIDNCRRATYGYDQRVEILGSKGSIATGNNYPNAAVVSDAASVRRDLPLNFFMDRYTESFAVEVAAFVDAVLHDKPVPVGGTDARVSVAIGLAAARSHREGRPVKVREMG
ncbi:MAG: Inositol 2-dehydrogenase [Chloroflexi bacterium ADurb.Bin325]|nr:MAG: Inositol 2-dehydrogenase [Chloroflexi bacterium ADurb.Bin325]